MSQLRYPGFLETACVGPDGNLSGFKFKIFENQPDAVEGSDPGPEITDGNPFCAIAHMGTALPLVYDTEEGCYRPAEPIALPPGTRLGLSIPPSEGVECNIVVIEVQPCPETA